MSWHCWFCCRQIWQSYLNIRSGTLEFYFQEKKLKKLFVSQNRWMRFMVDSHSGEEGELGAFWRHLAYVLAQFEGLCDGYKAAAEPEWVTDNTIISAKQGRIKVLRGPRPKYFVGPLTHTCFVQITVNYCIFFLSIQEIPKICIVCNPSSSSMGLGECCESFCSGVRGRSPAKSNLMHFSLKIWHLVTTILIIFLRINWSHLSAGPLKARGFRRWPRWYRVNPLLPPRERSKWRRYCLLRISVILPVRTGHKPVWALNA